MKTFASILHPETTGYHVVSSGTDNWNKRGSAPLLMCLTKFETYGDGLTQHSADWCPQWGPDLIDVCISLASAILAEPGADEWSGLRIGWDPFVDSDLRWAMTVGFSDKTTRWYSTTLKAVSARDKRHDRRWEKVEPWMDGRASSAFSILMKDNTHIDWLARLNVACRLEEISWEPDQYRCYMPKIFTAVEQLPERWEPAFLALRNAIKMIDGLHDARRMLDSAISTHKKSPEPNAAAA